MCVSGTQIQLFNIVIEGLGYGRNKRLLEKNQNSCKRKADCVFRKNLNYSSGCQWRFD